MKRVMVSSTIDVKGSYSKSITIVMEIYLHSWKVWSNMTPSNVGKSIHSIDMVWRFILLKLLRQLRGGVNQLLLCLNNFESIKPFLIFLQVTINIIQHMDNINSEHHSHIRYTQR
jgi:hypothetical protein